MPGVDGVYDLIYPFDVRTPPVQAYCSGSLASGDKNHMRVVGSIPKVDAGVLSFGFVLRAVCVASVKSLLLYLFIGKFDGRDAIMCVLEAMFKEWFALDIIILIDGMNVIPKLAFVDLEILSETDWNAHASHGCFPYDYKNGKLCLVGISALMIARWRIVLRMRLR